MKWVEFVDEAAFHTYHDAACADNGIPYPGTNQETNEVHLEGQWTSSWVMPFDDNGVLKSYVPDLDVRKYGLTKTTTPVDTVETDIVYDKEPNVDEWTS